MRRLIIDSNVMQSEILRNYLSASENNYAVINDYASMEAYKGNTLTSIFRSMEILSEFPKQIIVLKTTGAICALYGRKQGLQRRLINERQTNDFPTFCRRLSQAQAGDLYIQRQILESGQVANYQMERILMSAPIMPDGINELRKTFSPEELKIIRLNKPFSISLIRKAMQFIIDLTFITMERHPSPPPKIKNIIELQNTFLFRHAIMSFVWSLEWIAQGGADNLRPDKMRNDLVDLIFATYATYFDGLLSNDKKANRIYQKGKFILSMLTE